MSVFLSFVATISSKDIATNMEVECKVDLLFIQFLFALLLYIFASLNLFWASSSSSSFFGKQDFC